MLTPLGDQAPQVDPTAWVAPGAVLAGDVTLGPQASVWYTAVLRADGGAIRIGPRSNVQDGCVMHTDPGLDLDVGADVTVGHRAVLHGCVVEDGVLVGMGAIVMNGARIGTGSLIAAGALVPEGTQVPPGSLVIGAPARIRRPVTEGEAAVIRVSAGHYLALADRHRQEFPA